MDIIKLANLWDMRHSRQCKTHQNTFKQCRSYYRIWLQLEGIFHEFCVNSWTL